MKQRKNHGFTLIELLVTVIIIGVLTVAGMISYAQVNKQSRDAKRKSDLEQIRAALEMYRADYGYYPNVGSGQWVAVSALNTGNDATGLVSVYMNSIPSDPKSDQQYSYKAVQNSDNLWISYCLSTKLETTVPATNPCTPNATYEDNFALKNP